MLVDDVYGEHDSTITKIEEEQFDMNFTNGQYCPGRKKVISLKTYCAEHTLDLNDILNLAIKVTTLLGDIHGSGGIHKQITPETMAVDPDTGEISIRPGIGNSRTTLNEENLFDPDFQINVLPYLSPECTGRVNAKVDYRSDFYSAGIVFYELLAEKLPFPEVNPVEIIHAHIAKVPLPPKNAHHEIPQIFSDIVIKMLAKSPDDRYQSSWGLLKDLNECLQRLTPEGRIDPFEIGTHDMVMQFRRPSILVGRETEIIAIMDAYDRAENGNRELVMVSGEPGAGKSALTNGLRTKIEEKGGFFIYGKNEQSDQNTPYCSIIMAFQGAVKRLLSGNERSVNEWRKRLAQALTTNGTVITDVIPEIELITGPQPDLPEVGPEETRNRFKRVFRSFVQVFASQEHPLVIFLDDLQWADAGSLEMINSLVTNTDIGCLLLIGTFRDNEVNALHPLNREINKIKKETGHITSLSLPRLSIGHVHEILEDFYRISGKKTWELADLIQNKTRGNPFFINQFIKNLYEENLFEPDPSSGWSWNFSKILQMQVTENVVELLEKKIKKLSEPVVELLKICACIGNGFGADVVSAVKSEDIPSFQNELTLAVTEGYLNYDYGSDRYRFEHERIRETVYSLIDHVQKESIHYKVGQILRLRYSDGLVPELIFPIVHHLKIGKRLLKTPEELLTLLNFTVLAGEKARKANAYLVAAGFFDDAITLLPDQSWTEFFDISFRCYSGLAICHYLSLNFELAEAAFNTAILNTENDEDKAYLYNVKAIMVANLGFHEDAVGLCLKGLRMLGVEIPYNAGRLTLMKEIFKTRILLGIKTNDDLLNLSELKGRQNSLIIDLAMTMSESAFFVNPKLQALVNLIMVQFIIKNGINDKSAFFFMTYAYILIAGLNNSKAGIAFGELALNMNRKYKNAHIHAKMSMIYAIVISIRTGNIGRTIKQLESAFVQALENGDFRYGMYVEQCILFTMFSKGVPLIEIEKVYIKNYDFLVRTRDSGAVSYNDSVRQTIKCLRGETRSWAHLDDADFSEKNHIKKMVDDNIPIILQRHFLLRLIVLYMMGYYEESYAAAVECRRYRDSSVGLVTEDDRGFYTVLTLLGLFRKRSDEKILKNKEIQTHLKQMLRWAVICPENFLHKFLLVQAEIAFLTGVSRKDEEGTLQAPENLYGRAVQLATDHGFVLDTAIACERAAGYYKNCRVPHMAMYYLKEACEGFRMWGAKIKVRQLEDDFSDRLREMPFSDRGLVNRRRESFDYKVVVDSLQMISTEIVLERLLENLMKVIMENAGAERAVFISLQEDQVHVEAELNIGNSENAHGHELVIKQIEVNEATDLLRPVVNLVRRTGEYVVLDNALEQGDFIHHQYVKTKKIKSLLCLPVMRQSEPVALLYLENNVAAGVFTLNRIEILQLLASQAAISFENARLYDRASRKEMHLRMLTEKLRSLASELVLTEDRERRKMAVELHDHLGHALANIRISLGMLKKSTSMSGEMDMDVFEHIKSLVDQSITDVQSLTFELSPPVLYDLGLEGAIEWLTFNTAKQHGLTIHYDEGTEQVQMDDSIRALLFRAVRELLFNIVKHAQATNVRISLRGKDGFIHIEIEDDGMGFLPENLSESMKSDGGYGLFSIQERLAIYGGSLDIQTAPGDGTKVVVVSPLHSALT